MSVVLNFDNGGIERAVGIAIGMKAAFIAINLAVMNMLPLPALDGGRIFLLLVNSAFTALTKKKIPARLEGFVHAAGMVILPAVAFLPAPAAAA